MKTKYHTFNFTDNNVVITFKKQTFSRTDSGKSWKKNADTVETETVSNEFYSNYINSVSFFNNFGGFASCRAYYGYTYAGYIPVYVSTVSYDGKTKIKARFSFKPAN